MTDALTSYFPWNDRLGRFSVLRLAAFVAVLLPLGWILWRYQSHDLGPRPVTEAIHQTGLWAVRLLLATLAVTPIRLLTGSAKLVAVRRTLGLATLFYVLCHLTLYLLDLKFDLGRAAYEIAVRTYLTIGFVAVIGYVALGATSSDAAIRRLGTARWNRLHGLVHWIMVLSILHFLMQSKLDITEAAIMMGFFLFGALLRLTNRPGVLAVIGLSLLTTLLTALGEALWYGLATRVSGWQTLYGNLDFDPDLLRPVWIVLPATLALAVLPLFRKAPQARARR